MIFSITRFLKSKIYIKEAFHRMHKHTVVPCPQHYTSPRTLLSILPRPNITHLYELYYPFLLLVYIFYYDLSYISKHAPLLYTTLLCIATNFVSLSLFTILQLMYQPYFTIFFFFIYVDESCILCVHHIALSKICKSS